MRAQQRLSVGIAEHGNHNLNAGRDEKNIADSFLVAGQRDFDAGREILNAGQRDFTPVSGFRAAVRKFRKLVGAFGRRSADLNAGQETSGGGIIGQITGQLTLNAGQEIFFNG